MNDAGYKAYPGQIPVWLAVLLILLTAMAVGTPVTVAKMPCTPQNHAGESSISALQSRLALSPQTPDLQLENPSGQRKSSQDDDSLAQAGTLGASTPASVPAMIGGAALTTCGTVQGSTSAVNAYNNFQSGNLAGGAADTALAALDFGGAGFAGGYISIPGGVGSISGSLADSAPFCQ